MALCCASRLGRALRGPKPGAGLTWVRGLFEFKGWRQRLREDYNSQTDQLFRLVQGSILDGDSLDLGAGS